MDFKVNPAVTETKVVEISPATYTVTLTEKEAVVIASLIGNVYGPSEESEFRRIVGDLWGGGFRKFLYSESFRGLAVILAPKGDL